MTSTVFIDKQTVIEASWLNDVNTKTYADTSNTVEYTPAGTGAVATTVQSKLREFVSVLDFGADPTGATDSRNAFRLAATYALNYLKTVLVPNGTYRIDSPIFTDAETVAGSAYQFSIVGSSPTRKSIINLQYNTTYFSCFGYQPFIQNLWFINGVDVIHFNTQSIDYSVCKLVDVSALNWSGNFFKAVGNANSTHITWDRPMLVSSNASSVVFNDKDYGYDALAIHDGWIETSSNISFYSSTGRLDFHNTRFVPYTTVNSVWVDYYGAGNVTFTNTDFGGESGRVVIKWETAGGLLNCNSVGFFSDAGLYDIDLVAPPSAITFVSCLKNTSSTPDLIRVNSAMTAANLLLFSYTNISAINCDSSFDQLIVNNNSAPQAISVVSKNRYAYIDNYLKTSELAVTSGSSWLSAGYAPTFTSTVGVSDVFGSDTYGITFTATSAGSGYQYFLAGGGSQTIGTGDYTFETLVTVTVPCVIALLFGAPNVTGAAEKTFYLGVGTHQLCMPVYITSTMAKTFGVSFSCSAGGAISFSRIRIFSCLYNRRDKNFYAAAAPTSVNYTWCAGDRVINSAPTVGQPKSWVCTVTGTPGTWVSEGNL